MKNTSRCHLYKHWALSSCNCLQVSLIQLAIMKQAIILKRIRTLVMNHVQRLNNMCSTSLCFYSSSWCGKFQSKLHDSDHICVFYQNTLWFAIKASNLCPHMTFLNKVTYNDLLCPLCPCSSYSFSLNTPCMSQQGTMKTICLSKQEWVQSHI